MVPYMWQARVQQKWHSNLRTAKDFLLAQFAKNLGFWNPWLLGCSHDAHTWSPTSYIAPSICTIEISYHKNFKIPSKNVVELQYLDKSRYPHPSQVHPKLFPPQVQIWPDVTWRKKLCGVHLTIDPFALFGPL
jgi:hypothetical protein